ncbi:P-loop containing nucleoside triphosphate hydrolase protein [Aspergillus eucalypticola CBS 122712]|uniref:P-loop containing nucleoside triphosphate hydrolase protein n=1 Tax=Aspergillus eucalypticola (strain CBS 122712 / IBT 29274) TaxID=1448314 RepID=A0A317W7N6_ASPEC|nr:P-loop containing nucleoside triphosphate hydrolase protein [Aspergillus eucalypticola CBS 122712]PWY82403.1 P-loop containing nucleoside triphosphate hydrolase protein [Aspergillus eucalypticola CBS 122712]
MIRCPICQKHVFSSKINEHLDSSCQRFIANFHLQNTISSSLIENGSNPPERTKQLQLEDGYGSTEFFAGGTGVLKRAIPQPQFTIARKKPYIGSATERLRLRTAPLAEQVRPRCFDDIVGQESLIGPNGTLIRLIEQDELPNMILWGPPGSGKTTIARVIGRMMRRKAHEISSLTTTTTEYKDIVTKATQDVRKGQKPSIVFCDEIHRLTRPQQDIFLDAVQKNKISLIGATTENPSLNIHHTLVYKCKVFSVTKPTTNDLVTILRRSMESQTHMKSLPFVDDEFLQYIAGFADGDSRTALNVLEIATDLCTRPSMTKEKLKQSLTKSLLYDRSGDQHYDTISALHKSIRGSDPDAALYYLARMLQSGENPLFIARRLVVATSEDIGLANNVLQTYATSVYLMIEKLGIKDAQSPLAQLVVTMCLSKKSTRSYRGLNNALAAVKEPGMGDVPVPFHALDRRPELLREAARLMSTHSKQAQDRQESTQGFLPRALEGRKFLEDTDFLFKRDSDLSHG